MIHDHGNQESPPNFWRTRYGVGCLVIGAVAAYFLFTEHLAHTLSALPYLLLAACPLMHFFMHGGHGHGVMTMVITQTIPKRAANHESQRTRLWLVDAGVL
jgi:hypothetical protein